MFLSRFAPRNNLSFVRRSRASPSRTMATGKAKEFLCIMPDNPNVLELRKQVKGQHYEGIQPLVAQGKLVDGGAIFKVHSQDGKDAQFRGSVVVYTGESAEEVRSIIMHDIYARSGVWDIERIEIIPYVPAFRQPLPRVHGSGMRELIDGKYKDDSR